MTNLMASLGNQVIKILPRWCFKEAPEYQAFQYETYEERLERLEDGMTMSEEEKREAEQEDIARMARHNAVMGKDPISWDEYFDEVKPTSIFKVRINWIVMYVIGIVTGAMGVFLYQVLQSTYKLL